MLLPKFCSNIKNQVYKTVRLLVRQCLRPGCKSRRDWKFSRVRLRRQQVPICELHEFPLDNALSSSSKFFLGYHSLLYVIKVGDNWKFSHVESRQQDPICELHDLVGFSLGSALAVLPHARTA